MKKTEITLNTDYFPEQLHKYFENARVYDSSCSPDMAVYYSDIGYYVKVAALHTLANEAAVGRLFHSLSLGPAVTEYISTDRDYLVTEAVQGTDLTHCVDEPEMICRILAEALTLLHGKCGYSADISPAFTEYLRIADSYDCYGFKAKAISKTFAIADRETAESIIKANIGRLRADTLIHGDACLPNLMQMDGKFISFIDFTTSGIGDKHIDLYWAIWSLWYNLKTDKYTDLFLDLYGRDKFDFELIRTVAALELVE